MHQPGFDSAAHKGEGEVSAGPQKAEHGGKFSVVPYRVLKSVAWLHLSLRARVALQIFQMSHNGFNNGSIAMGVKALSAALGDQNHRAASRAIVELIEHGFLECMSDASRSLAKVREYRLTYISTGKEKRIRPATHEYADWRPVPGAKKKFGGAVSATRTPSRVTDTANNLQVSVIDFATLPTESRRFEGLIRVADTAHHIVYQSRVRSSAPANVSGIDQNVDQTYAGPSLAELREWCETIIRQSGYGGARQLAADAGIPESALSKFRKGRNLPAQYQSALHMACARALSHSAFLASRTAEISG